MAQNGHKDNDVMAVPSLDSARRARAAAEAEDAFWHESYDGYLKEYPDQFVALRSTAVDLWRPPRTCTA